jgi:diphthamide biosynthesis protein 3
MSVYHDEVEIEDMEYDEEEEMYYYPCPCGDRFQITREDLENGEETATCPSCSLLVKVIYDKVLFCLRGFYPFSRRK